MAILLPEGHPHHSLGTARRDAEDASPRVRIGIVNIMPRLEAYEASLLTPLAAAPGWVEPVFVRLGSHAYQSSDQAHLDRFYQPFEAAIAERPLDGLLLTGAPVEELAFADVRYWRELEEILRYARRHVACTLGLCWGGLALGKVLGIEKRLLPKKLFGVFEDRVLVPSHDALEPGARSFVCAQSRHSGADEEDLARAVADGAVRALARGERTGTTMFETTDGRYLAHLGHPEYEGERLAFEWNRDRALGRADVEPPVSFDADAPETTWRGHRDAVVSGFVARASHATATREGRARGLSEARAAAARDAP